MNEDKRKFYEQILVDKHKDLHSKVKERLIVAAICSDDPVGDICDACVQSLLRDQFFSLGERERKTLEMVEQALQRMRSNIYGLCEECDEPINDKRLEALAWAELCTRCQSQKERDFSSPSVANYAGQ
jgi:RNA polymerase-binding protein DksA